LPFARVSATYNTGSMDGDFACGSALPASAIFTFGTAFIFGRLPGVEVCWHRVKHNISRQIANHGQTDSGSPVVFSFQER
jgi:hypothetical protein